MTEEGPEASGMARLRERFHEVVSALLVPDLTYVGDGLVYTIEADLDEVISEAAGLLDEEDEQYVSWEDSDIFERMADGTAHDLVTVSTADSFGDSINSATILGRGYLYFPGMSIEDTPSSLVGAWEPASSRVAFEHAFIAQYLANADGWDTYLHFWVSEGIGIDGVSSDVSPEPLAEAMNRYLEANPMAWWDVWETLRTEPEPDVSWVEANASISAQTLGAVTEPLTDEDKDFKEVVLSLSQSERRGVLYIYLHAMGLMPQDPWHTTHV
jgi:hypothetical protein